MPLLYLATAVSAATLNVGSGQTYKTVSLRCILSPTALKANLSTQINAAVSASAAGDTIVVYPGTYREQVIISKDSITLKGSTFPSKNPFQNTAVLIHALYAGNGINNDGSGKMREKFQVRHEDVY